MTLINALPMHVALIDGDGNILAVNDRWSDYARLNGGDERACGAGANYLRVCSGSDVDSPIREVLAGRRSAYEAEYPCHSPREKQWFNMRVAPLGRSRRAGFLVLHQDVTQHVRTREAIDKQRGNLQTLLEGAADGIHVTDVHGNLIHFSHSFARMLGYGNLEMSRLKASDWTAAHTNAQSGSLTGFRSLQFRRKDGSTFPVEVHESRMMMDGHHYLYCSARDITDRLIEERRATSERDQLTELERIHRELDEFVYVASHDLRSPLRAITALTQWIIDDDRSVDANTAARLKQVQLRVQRMSRLLDDILLYARAGKIKSVSGDAMTAAALVQEIVDTLDVPDGFVIRWDDSLADAHIRRVPLEQVLYNLIGNAIKHHDRSIGLIEIQVRSAGNRHVFSVTDDGPGISEQFHESVFEMFTTLKPRDEVEGSGMGLAVVRKILCSLGGNCGLESCGERGTRIWFDWPKGDAN
jgi:PAS domain S-box-containing protein